MSPIQNVVTYIGSQRNTRPDLTPEIQKAFEDLDELLVVSPSGRIAVSLPRANAAGLNPHQINILEQVARDGNTALPHGVEKISELIGKELSYSEPDTTPHLRASSGVSIKVKVKVWGLRITMSHKFVQRLSTVTGAVAALLAACGVAAWICAIIAAILAAIAVTLKALDDGAGCQIDICWGGFPVGMKSL